MAQNVRAIPTEVLDASLSEAKKVSISEKSVKASISFSSLSHEASESNNVFLSGHLALFINLKNKRDIVSKLTQRGLKAFLRVYLPLQFRSGQKRGPLM